MTAEVLIALAAVAAAAVTGTVTWKIAKRSTSGAINTSEAATLWDEGTTMRQELREEVVALKAQVTEAMAAIVGLNADIRLSRQETEAAREETRKSREETRMLMLQIASLHRETREVLGEVKTNNTMSIGALADNTETRRILDLPIEDRTPKEKEHLRTAKDRLPHDLRAKQGDEEEDEVDE